MIEKYSKKSVLVSANAHKKKIFVLKSLALLFFTIES